MQYKAHEYNPRLHDTFKALTIKQPYASMIMEGVKTTELRTRNTSYRGDIVITASVVKTPDGLPTGCTIAIVDLYDVKKVEDLSETEKEAAMLAPAAPYWKKAKYAWLMRNPRPVIEFPVRGQLGIWNLVYTKGVIIPYPEYAKINPKKKGKIQTAILVGSLLFMLIGLFFIIFYEIIKMINSGAV